MDRHVLATWLFETCPSRATEPLRILEAANLSLLPFTKSLDLIVETLPHL